MNCRVAASAIWRTTPHNWDTPPDGKRVKFRSAGYCFARKKRGAHAVHRKGGSTGGLKLRDDCGSVWYDGEKQQEAFGWGYFLSAMGIYVEVPESSAISDVFAILNCLLHHYYTTRTGNYYTIWAWYDTRTYRPTGCVCPRFVFAAPAVGNMENKQQRASAADVNLLKKLSFFSCYI